MPTAPLTQRAARTTTVCVVGAGYVGLTGAACLAELGHTVRCVETDPDRLAQLQAGGVPIVEPGLLELLTEHRRSGRLTFTGDVHQAVPGAQVALLCVGTPPQPSGEPDLRQIGDAACQVAAAATADLVIAVKSTVPPGTCEALELLCAEHAGSGVRVHVGSNPEFLRESHAVHDFLFPDRVVVGAEEPAAARLLAELYPTGTTTEVICDRRSAELIKYAANTFLAVKISFANEVAELCTRLGADSDAVLQGVGLDPRIGGAFLGAGPGFGGACLPKDVAALIATGHAAGHPMLIARAADEVNRTRQDHVVTSLDTALGGLVGAQVTVLGLAFKPDTDDVRSPLRCASCASCSRAARPSRCTIRWSPASTFRSGRSGTSTTRCAGPTQSW